MRGAEVRPDTPVGGDDAGAAWGPWTEDDGSSDAIVRRERLRRVEDRPSRPRCGGASRRRRRGWAPRGRLRRHRRRRRPPRSSTLLTVLAGVLAVLGVALIAGAAASQVSPPTPPPVGEPSDGQVVPVPAVDPADAPLLLAAPWALGPSPLGPYPARWWWGDLLDGPRGLLPRGPGPVPGADPARSGPAGDPARSDPAEADRLRALAAVPVSPPATITIPTIGVVSPVESVGLAPSGEMEVPAPGPLYDRAAWYRYSVTPGRQGPSVIIGHTDSRETGPSVFFELGRMRPGDRVDVARADGVVVTFAVSAVRTVAKDTFPTDAVYGATRGPELRLITCGGSFDAAARSYRDNIVVFAREVPPPPVRADPPVPTTPAPGLPARVPMRLPGR